MMWTCRGMMQNIHMHCCNPSFLYITNISASNGLITCVGRSDFDLDFFHMRLRMLPSTWMIENSIQIFGFNISLEPTTLSSHRGFFVIHRISYGPLRKLGFSVIQGVPKLTSLKKKSFFVIQRGPNQPWEYRITYRRNPRSWTFSQYRKVSSIESSILSIIDTEKLCFFVFLDALASLKTMLDIK